MMFRITIFSVFALASAVVASAGQIQVGGATGLTTSYVTNGGASPNNACTGTCTDQNNYDEVLFQGLDGTTPAPGTHYSLGGPTVNSTITDTNANALAASPTGITFAMINDGTYENTSSCGVGALSCGTPNSSNYWSLPGDGTLSTLTIPVDQYGVSQVWSMLDTDYAGASNGAPADRSITMFLDFGTAGGTIEDSVRVNFTNTGDNGTGTGQIESSILCTSIAPCDGIATPNTGPIQTTNPATLTANGVSVSASVDYLYSIKYAGTGNLLVLNDEGLNLGTINFAGIGTNLNTYLVDIRVVEEGNTNYASEIGAVSAVTVLTAAPEPSTVFMFLTGLGAIGFAGFRRRKA
jgi:hypothetical protein